MSFIKKPLPGGAVPAKDTRAWQQIQEVVNAYHSGRFGRSSEPVNKVPTLRAIAPRKMAVGDVACFPRMSKSPTSDTRNHIAVLEEIEWHDNITSIAVAATPAVGAGAEIQVTAGGFVSVNLSDDVRGYSSDPRMYVMPHPDTEGKMKPAHSGMYEIMFYTSDNTAVVNTSRGQNYWRYKLETDWDGDNATAELEDIRGYEFGVSVELTDELRLMDDQGIGDEGVCLQIGNHFVPIQANCS